MFNCPICNDEVKQLVIPPSGKKYGCRSCVYADENQPKRFSNCNLGQTVEAWTHVDKKGVEHKHRLSVGKAWEIDNRTLSRDNPSVVINKKTGKEAQY